MKRATMLALLFLLSCLLICAGKIQAQTSTNLAVRWTLEIVTAGVTNSANTTLRWDYGNKKEALKIDGLQFAYSNYAATFGTNPVPATFHTWLRTNYTDFVKGYADQKQAADNRIMAEKITRLLTAESDLLTTGDLSSLATIAAKLP